MHQDHDMIRQRAFEIWEAEGCPEGRDEIHWHQAVAEFQNGAAAAQEDESSLPKSVAALDETTAGETDAPVAMTKTTKPKGVAARPIKSRKPKQ